MTDQNNSNGDTGGEAATEQVSSEAESTQSTEIRTEDVPYLSDEQIEAGLSDKPESEEGDDSPSEEAESTETDDTKDASDTEAGDDQENSDDGKVSKEEHENLKKELLNKNRVNEANQKFIQKTRSQYGELRKSVLEQIANLEARLPDMTPGEETEARFDIRSLKDKAAKIKQNENLFEHVVKTREEVEAIIPEDEWNVNAMAEVLTETGEDAEYVNLFKQNAYAVADSKKILLLHNAAKYRNVSRVLAAALKKAKAENTEKGKAPKKVLQNIDKVAKQAAGLTNHNGGGKSHGKNFAALTEADIANLSETELNEALAQSTRR